MTDTNIDAGVQTNGHPRAAGPTPAKARWLFLLPLILAAGFALSPTGADADLWGHVQFGRDTLAAGLARTTTYSFTAEGYRWINHENLSEVCFALIVDLCGATGLLILRCGLGVFVVGGLVWRMRQQAHSLLTIYLLTALVILNLVGHWSIRPQLMSYALFAVMLFILSAAFRRRHGCGTFPWLRAAADGECDWQPQVAWLWALPPLFLVWANAHGGFVAGLCVLLLFLSLRSAELLRSQGTSAVSTVGGIVLAGVATAAVTLANPYGIDLHQWLFESLGTPRPEITEWHGLSWSNSQTWVFIPLVVIGLVSIVLSRRPLDLTQLTVLGVIGWQAASHQRHIAFFAIACGCWLPPYVDSAVRRLKLAEEDNFKPSFSLSLSLAAASLILCVLLPPRLGTIAVERDRYPVSAVAYMAEQNLSGNLVVTYNWSQYVIAALGDRVRVGFDGRFRTCYPDEVVDMHFDFVIGDVPQMRHRDQDSPPLDGTRVLRFADPDLVLLSRRQQHSTDVMQTVNDWVLLYQDELSQLWGKRFKYGEQNSADFVPAARRQLADNPQTGSVQWPAMPQRPGASVVTGGQRADDSKS